MKSLFSFLRRGPSDQSSRGGKIYRAIRARFDAALDNPENRRHWLLADGASADAEANAEIRAKLRNRARYEVANNSYAKGIAATLANYTIGTGPRLQVLTENRELNRQLERCFTEWSEVVDFAEKLRIMRLARVSGGEAFVYFYQNPSLPYPLKLDFQIIEADRIGSDPFNQADKSKDGIFFDTYGNPESYRLLERHPGDVDATAVQKARIIPATQMAHYFRAERPGQHRGIPDMTPALPLFAMLRRFTLAVIAAAESAANFAGILYTDAPASGEADSIDPMDLIELERNMLLTAPAGWKLGQLKAEQPTTTYPTFTEKILNEIARGMGVPYGIALGNSAGFNYASGRLDYQSFYKLLSIEQGFIATRVLAPLMKLWIASYEMAGLERLSRNTGNVALPYQWFWDGVEHVDPAKEATAQATRLANNTTTLAIEYARQGKDWEEQLRQRAKEKELLTELGLSPSEGEPARNDAVDEDGKQSPKGNANNE